VLLLIAMKKTAKFILSTLLIAVFLIVATIPTAEAQLFTTIYVDPPSVRVPVSTQFTVTVNITAVVNLFAWQFNMTFDPALLECKGVTEGPFLKTGGPTIFAGPVIDNNNGWVLVGCSLAGPIPGVTGSGDLAFVTFHCRGVGDGKLEFDPATTYLLDPQGAQIPREAIGGSVTQYSRAVGGVLVPVNNLTILAPYLALVGLIGAVTVAVAATRRRKP